MTTQHRTKGKSSEAYFLYKYYDWAPDCSYTLAEHHLDSGVDFILPNHKKVQVKRFNYNNADNQNRWRLDLRRKRNAGVGNYTKDSFDFLVAHDHKGATGYECLRYARMSDIMSKKTGIIKSSVSVNKLEELTDFSVFFTS